MPGTKTKKKFCITDLLTISLLSLLIGTTIRFAMSGSLYSDLESFLLNSGYSILIGVGLFANGYIFNSLEAKWLSWTERPVSTIIIAVSITTIYSSAIIWGLNILWFRVIAGISQEAFKAYVYDIIIIEYIVLYIITLFMYAKAFFNEWRTSIVSEEKLKQQAIELQYKVLSNQVNPHFLFNSLNVLSSLISIDTERAEAYVNKLSDFYRKLLAFRGKDIIPLSDELDFVKQYFDLQKERFGNNFIAEIDISNAEKYQIIPMTIQMLVENAIKHNQMSKEHPLNIGICIVDDAIKVSNSLKPYNNPVQGERLGLSNLKERYAYLSDRDLKILLSNKQFSVVVPLLILEQ